MRGGRWVARPLLAALLRLFILVVPAVAGMAAAWAVTELLGEPSGVAETVGWWTALVAAAVTAVVVTQRLAKRLLPLAWLLHLTLAFPDRAPSRLKIARRAARGRALRKAATEARHEGLGDDAAAAAARALVLVAALGAHDRRTRGHSERVRGLADVLAEEAGVAPEDRDRLRWAALLHDIGKLAVPGEILNKPDRPDDAEWETLRRHPEEGDRLVTPLVEWLGPWAASVAHHHEHWDGSGYPRGLAGEDISLGGRILAIADAYEVMTASRPYKSPQRPDVARKELVASAGVHFDPVLVRHFLAVRLGKLWWLIGGSAVLSLVPWLAGLWTAPAGAAIRRTGSGPATAAAAVGVLALAGVVAPAAAPLRSDPAPIEVAAPVAVPSPLPAPDPVAVTPVSSLALAPAGAGDSGTRLRGPRSRPSSRRPRGRLPRPTRPSPARLRRTTPPHRLRRTNLRHLRLHRPRRPCSVPGARCSCPTCSVSPWARCRPGAGNPPVPGSTPWSSTCPRRPGWRGPRSASPAPTCSACTTSTRPSIRRPARLSDGWPPRRPTSPDSCRREPVS